MPIKTLIMGAAGRDFHNFNTFFRGNRDYEVVAFTATQIPDIAGRVYPPELAGELYPGGIPIRAEEELVDLIKQHGYRSIWLESSFDHCWFNIRHSRKERPLARSKEDAKKLFDERQSLYCLADHHFIVRPEYSSYEIAHQLIEQII